MASDILQCCLGGAPPQEKNDAGDQKVWTIAVHKINILHKPVQPPDRTEKQFVARESLLTEIFNSQNGASLYRMCLVMSTIALCSSAALDLINKQPLNIGQVVLWNNVKGIPLALLCWLVMLILVLVLYYIFKLWVSYRPKCTGFTICDLVFILPAFVLTIGLLLIPATCILLLSLTPVCSFGLLMEQIRFFTKAYAFLRVKIPDVLSGGNVPDYSHFFMFLAVPTFVYKDSFPRSGVIRWKKVIQHCLELAWAGLMIISCLARVHAPVISGFRSVWLDAEAALTCFVGTLVPTSLVLLLGFYAYFHSFCNLQAEITSFQDRMFYKDWWNATSFKTFFTTWNTIVQDWLYQYVYLDVRRTTGSSTLASGAVFLVSGIVHEYVLSFFFRFFYPVLVIVFVGAGLILKSIPTARVSPAFGNLTLWICIPVGSSIIMTAYMTEFFSRINCPYSPETMTFLDYLIPRSWTCPMTA